MKCLQWIVRGFAAFALVIGTASPAFAQGPLENISAVVEVTAAACSGTGCQPATTPTPGPTPGAPASGQCNNGAGPNPVKIEATVSLCQVNGVLRGIGRGINFEVGKTYVSLLYKNPDTGTCSRAPSTPGFTPLLLQNAADPSVDSDFASMMLGIWVVAPDGTGTLIVNKQAPVTGLQNYRTVSVREVQAPNVACYQAGFDPAPQLNALRACGLISFGPACSITNVCDSLCLYGAKVCVGDILKQYTAVCDPLPPIGN